MSDEVIRIKRSDMAIIIDVIQDVLHIAEDTVQYNICADANDSRACKKANLILKQLRDQNSE